MRSSMTQAQPFPLANAVHIHFNDRSVCAIVGASGQSEKRVTSGNWSISWKSPQSLNSGSRSWSLSVRSKGNPLFEWRITGSVYLGLFVGCDDVFEWDSINRDAEYAAVGKGDA